jgi:hypothetical protein
MSVLLDALASKSLTQYRPMSRDTMCRRSAKPSICGVLTRLGGALDNQIMHANGT